MHFVTFVNKSILVLFLAFAFCVLLPTISQSSVQVNAYRDDELGWDWEDPAGRPEIEVVKEYGVRIDDAEVALVPAPTKLWPLASVTPGPHVAEVTAKGHAGEESEPSEPLAFVMQAGQSLDFNLSVDVVGACTLSAPAGSDVDFGQITIGGSATRSVDVRNDGTGVCSVTGITIGPAGSVFSISAPIVFPTDIAPAATLTITVDAAGNAIGSHAATMSVVH
jgi:hypothetical protein